MIPYPNKQALNNVIQQLKTLPPLVEVEEILTLKKQLGEAALGQRFLLQGGDCAERFLPDTTDAQLNLLLTLKAQLTLQKPVICVGRIAGQYAKPRTSETETYHGITLPSYQGDMINQLEFTPETRIPDPYRMLTAYQCAANILSRMPENIYTSHEAFLLYYEQALTRLDKKKIHYNFSTHFPWCGMRTQSIDSPHIAYLSTIANPVALKIGPQITPETIITVLDKLNPHNDPGRITLIHRFGIDHIKTCLPTLIKRLKICGKIVLWSCDPLHGNTTKISGIKTRFMHAMLAELQQAIEIHAALNSYLGGIHLEMTPEPVSECAETILSLTDITPSSVDPRLNPAQALRMLRLLSPNADNSRNAIRICASL